jgi:hypothetical protein
MLCVDPALCGIARDQSSAMWHSTGSWSCSMRHSVGPLSRAMLQRAGLTHFCWFIGEFENILGWLGVIDWWKNRGQKSRDNVPLRGGVFKSLVSMYRLSISIDVSYTVSFRDAPNIRPDNPAFFYIRPDCSAFFISGIWPDTRLPCKISGKAGNRIYG